MRGLRSPFTSRMTSSSAETASEPKAYVVTLTLNDLPSSATEHYVLLESPTEDIEAVPDSTAPLSAIDIFLGKTTLILP
jgi:hypothetical protein